MKLLHTISILFRKELRLELRSKEVVYGAVLFSSIVVLLFSFSFLGGTPPSPEVKAGLLWVALSFSLVISIYQCFLREREGNTMGALLLTPIPRFSIYAAKCLVLLTLGTLSVACVLSLMFFFFTFSVLSICWLFVLLELGMVGFIGIACLFAVPLSKGTRGNLLLPILLYPLSIPLFIAGIRGTCAILCDGSLLSSQCQMSLLDPSSLEDLMRWVKFLAIFDLSVLLAAGWLFDPLCELN